MATSSANKDCDAVLDALAVGDISHARVLLTERDSLDFQKTTQVVISRGQCEALKFLITEYKLNMDEYYCLHLALLAGQEDIAKWLVDSGADVNKCWEVRDQIDKEIHWQKHVKLLRTYCGCYDASYFYPLCLSMNCSADMMRFLLESGANNSINRQITRYGETVLHIAVHTGNVEKIRLLIDHGADVEARTTVYETALMYACRNSTVSPDCVQVLLGKGANPNSRTAKWPKLNEAPIHCAIKNGDTQKLQLLIQHGAQLEARTSYGTTALILACKKYVPADCVRVLLEHGAFPNARSMFWQKPLALAKDTNNEEKIRLLKQYGATEEEKTGQEETALISACQRNGDVETVRHLLENNASPYLRNCRGETALHYAVLGDNIQKLQVLVEYNSDVNAMDDNGVTPLMKACKEVSVSEECVVFLLENNALPNLTDTRGRTAVHYSAQPGNERKLQLLAQHGADVNALGTDSKTPLMSACAEDSLDEEYVRCLLENNATVNLKDIDGSTALGYAIRTKQLRKVKLLLEYKADVNAMTVNQKAELMDACFSDGAERQCVKFLIENSPLPGMADVCGYTCLHFATERGDEELIDLLVQNQANVNAKTVGGKTPLIFACGSDFVDAKCVRSLLQSGALLNLTDEKNNTALDFAVNTKCIQKIRLLVDYGANVDTNYLNAARNNDREFLDLFYELGADISAVDGRGRNAIMLAIRRRRKFRDSATVQWLVDKGVSVNQRDKDGWTPLMASVCYGNAEIVKLLIEAGADVHAIRCSGGDYSTGTTALSRSFYRDGMSGFYCAKLLIRAGAVNSLPDRYNKLLHLMVILDNCKMINLLLTHGMAPTLRSLSYFDSDKLDPVSPLTLAVKYESFPVIRYLTDNMALCPCDVNGHLYHTKLRANLMEQNRTDVLSFMDEFYSQPRSLYQLCCITISYTVGGVPGRLDRINSLPLPEPLKEQLLFKNSNVPQGCFRHSP